MTTPSAPALEQRPGWDLYFMSIASVVATRATCPRLHVGAVLVRNNVILSTGYNGSIRGAVHCDDSGCDIVNHSCVRTVHAEANALLRANAENATLYCTHSPCLACYKLMCNAGVRRCVYGVAYRPPGYFHGPCDVEIIK